MLGDNIAFFRTASRRASSIASSASVFLNCAVILWVGVAGCGKNAGTNGAADAVDAAPVFSEISGQSQLAFTHFTGYDSTYFVPESIGSGAALLDYDNDGDLDVYFVNGAPHGRNRRDQPKPKNQLFRQETDKTFTNVTDASGLGDTGYGMGVAVGDIDNDGFVDVYISNYGPDKLYRNNGDGSFTDITRSARIVNRNWGCSVVFFDGDMDGFLDIFVTNYLAYNPSNQCVYEAGSQDYCGPAGFPGVADVLYRNNGDLTFTDVSRKAGVAGVALRGLGVVSADFDGDHLPDVYVANDGDPNILWVNQGDGTFTDAALRMGAAFNEMGRPEAGMGVAVGDVDNDADFDIFISHLRGESNTFYRKQAFGFQDDSAPSGIEGKSLPYTGFGTGFLDFENDGDLDLAVVNGRVTRGMLLSKKQAAEHWDYYAEPNLLFENDGDGRFTTIGEAGDFSTLIENSRGLAIGDLDNDGGVDALVTNGGGDARLFRNVSVERGHWLIVRALNPKLKRDAYGAQVTTHFAGRKLTRLIQPGYSFLSSNDPRAHFGLGDSAEIDSLVVQWPDGAKEKFVVDSVDRILTVEKGTGDQN